jgi:elongation factor Tu
MPFDASFRMTSTGVFTIKGRGTVVTGRVEGGNLKVGDEVYFKGKSGVTKTVVMGLEASGKQILEAQMDDTVGILLEGVDHSEIKKGDVLAGNDADYSWSF